MSHTSATCRRQRGTSGCGSFPHPGQQHSSAKGWGEGLRPIGLPTFTPQPSGPRPRPPASGAGVSYVAVYRFRGRQRTCGESVTGKVGSAQTRVALRRVTPGRVPLRRLRRPRFRCPCGGRGPTCRLPSVGAAPGGRRGRSRVVVSRCPAWSSPSTVAGFPFDVEDFRRFDPLPTVDGSGVEMAAGHPLADGGGGPAGDERSFTGGDPHTFAGAFQWCAHHTRATRTVTAWAARARAGVRTTPARNHPRHRTTHQPRPGSPRPGRGQGGGSRLRSTPDRRRGTRLGRTRPHG
jgi:hypothetical protein